MTSTHRTTIPKGVNQCLAATALMASIAIWAAAIAGATPAQDGYNRCIINGGYIDVCCIENNGDPIYDADGYPVGCDTLSPGPEDIENVPGEPGPTKTPPVFDPGQTGPSNPLISTPRGPNSGTLAP